MNGSNLVGRTNDNESVGTGRLNQTRRLTGEPDRYEKSNLEFGCDHPLMRSIHLRSRYVYNFK